MVQDPFKSGEIFIKPCKRSEVYLDEKELSKMVKLSYNNKLTIVERRILMMYLLSCTTGIRISDMRALKWCNSMSGNVPLCVLLRIAIIGCRDTAMEPYRF